MRILRIIPLVFFLFVATETRAQQYGDSSFYLLDSLKVDILSLPEKNFLDSSLTVYHQTTGLVPKLQSLADFTDLLPLDLLSTRYYDLLAKQSFIALYSGKISDEERIQVKRIYSKCLIHEGFYACNQGNPMLSLEYYFHALDFIRETNSMHDLISVYINIGAVYFQTGDVEKSLSYFEDALKLTDENTSPDLVLYLYNNLAGVHLELGNKEAALDYHLRSLDIGKRNQLDYGTAMANSNIAMIYISMSPDSVARGIVYLREAETAFKILNDNTGLSVTYNKLARGYLKLDDLKNAEINANFALFYAQKSLNYEARMRAFQILYQVNEANENYKDALDYYAKFHAMQDSVINTQMQENSRFKEIQYQYDSNKKILEKETEKQLALANANDRQQTIILFGIVFIALIAIVFSILQVLKVRQISQQKTQLEKQAEERVLLLKEIHHRVKNNFQIVCSMLRLQGYNEENAFIDRAFNDAINRINSMANVHEMIYREESFSEIRPVIYFERLTASIQHYADDRQITYSISSSPETLPVDTMLTLGIAVNELITNSIKHAFNQPTMQPHISISLEKNTSGYEFHYADNGTGFNVDKMSASFGSELIVTVIEQISGSIVYDTNSTGNCSLRILFN